MNIVLVHGFLNRGGILSRLAAHLTAAGHRCFVPTLTPADARGGLPAMAAQLADYIEGAVPRTERFVLVGFSMGALLSRYYLQELGGRTRAIAFFSLCGPHAGTVNAYLYPSAGARQMRPGSEFLAGLDATAERLRGLPIVCYWTPYDLMIRPLASARWSPGESVRIPVLVHSLMVFDRRLYKDIAVRIEKLAARPMLSPAA